MKTTWPVDPRCPQPPKMAEDVVNGDLLLHLRTGKVLVSDHAGELYAGYEVPPVLAHAIAAAVCP